MSATFHEESRSAQEIRRFDRLVVSLLPLFFLVCFALCTLSDAWAKSGPNVPRLHGLRSNYGSTVIYVDYSDPNYPNGVYRINISTTIARLKEAHVNAYAYLLIHDTLSNRFSSQKDWDDLPAFLTAAAAENIKVWVYLIPPGEVDYFGGGDYPPYDEDYKAWANAIATISNSHPNLQAFAMDDFGGDSGFFRPQYVKEMMDGAHAINDKLAFWPVLYYPNIVGSNSLIGRYEDVIDGIIFPFRDDSNPPPDTVNWGSAVEEMREVRKWSTDQVDLPSAGDKFSCYQISFPGNSWAAAGHYGQVAKTVNLTSSSSMTFWVWDSYDGPADAIAKQLLVDGTVVWEENLAYGDAGWHAVSVDLGAYAGSNRSLQFRVVAKSTLGNFPVNVRFDEIHPAGFSLSNGDFENTGDTAWVYSENNPYWSGDYISSKSYSYELEHPWYTVSDAGDYAQISQTVTVGSNATISFNYWDDYTGATSGYIFKELLLNNTVVWSEDIAGGDLKWHRSPEIAVAAGTYTLKFRVHITTGVGNFGVKARFGDIRTSGFSVANGNFQGSTGWAFGSYAADSTDKWKGRYVTAAKNLPVVTMVYAGRLGGEPQDPTSSYVNMVAAQTIALERMGEIDGVMIYLMPLVQGNATYEAIKTLYGGSLPPIYLGDPNEVTQAAISFPASTVSLPGHYAQISQNGTITNTTMTDYTVGFWVRDNYDGATAGYHFKQFLVNGTVMWEEDIAGDETQINQGVASTVGGWQYVQVNLTPYLKSLSTFPTSLPLAFRVYDKDGVGNFPVEVRFDQITSTNIALSNRSFESTPAGTGWTFSRNPGANWAISYPSTAP